MKICILGAGSWGTTLGLLLASYNHQVKLWEFRPEAAKRLEVDRENRAYLPGHPFPVNLTTTGRIDATVDGAELCVIAVPSHTVRSTIQKLKSLNPNCLIVSATKGIEEQTLMRMSEVILSEWGDGFSIDRFVVLSGPSHAEEVVLGQPTTVVAASPNPSAAREVQSILSGGSFRVYTHNDYIGVELGGSLKNVIALAAGIAAGLGFGDNTLGSLLTRGLAEISRLGQRLGGSPATFAGLSGMGDMIATCCSRHSRNRYVGEQIGRGRKLSDVLAGMVMVAEGVKTTRSAYALSIRERIDMPITEQVYKILYEDADPMKATFELMTRRLKDED